MIAKSDIVIITSASLLLLVAILRVGGPVSSPYSTPYYNTQRDSQPIGQVTLAAAPVESTPAVVLPQTNTATVKAEDSSIAEFKQPDVIREAAFRTHVVKSGEYLSLIAQRYNTSVTELKKLNKLSGTTILVGQQLVYPSN